MGLLFLALKYPEHEGLEERNIMHTWEEERKHYYPSNGFLIPFLELWMAFEHSKAGRLLCMIIGRLWFSYTPNQKYLHNGKWVGAPHFLSLFWGVEASASLFSRQPQQCWSQASKAWCSRAVSACFLRRSTTSVAKGASARILSFLTTQLWPK